MANIFKEAQKVNEHPKRNNFDLSRKSNVSLKFGTLYPVFCQPVVPDDSFDINAAFNLKLMPVVFPVQTKMRAHMHFFYVRNKNLWKNWENWIQNLPNASQTLHPHPYISLPDNRFKSGSIHDFLNVPTTAVGHFDYNQPLSLPTGDGHVYAYYGSSAVLADNLSFNDFDDLTTSTHTLVNSYSVLYFRKNSQGLNDISSSDFLAHASQVRLPSMPFYTFVDDSKTYIRVVMEGDDDSIISDPFEVHPDSNGVFDVIDEIKGYVSENSESYPVLFLVFIRNVSSVSTLPSNLSLNVYHLSEDFVQYSDMNIDLYSNHLRINALPYRAYESIYWAYYNNNVVSPMIIDGQVQYNRYNTNLEDGADNTDYHLFQRNYELDFLTSSLPSPQQGVAPLVGMSALGDITIEDENGITTAHATTDDDGTISKVVLTSPAASNEHARMLMNMAACGMSINDFRSTNALQRVLETNIRKGYRYLDFIAGHFGKEPEYRELDMPEFIGGFSRDIDVSTVVSNADTLGVDSGKSLGSYGGYAQVVGGSTSSVRHYCDDFGFIIGILSVVPTPCYSQLLPKHMIAPTNFLDYYFPEMSQIGMQPITYKEVCPIQAFVDSLVDPEKRLEDTFGYQRPNYDMIANVDEVHGEFRASLRNYVINRIFDGRPELGEDFIKIRPEEVNDIFVNTSPEDDSIIGEIGFSVHAKRPVPRVVIPNLGR